MREKLDKSLTDLKDNIDHFKKMIEQFHPEDERLNQTASQLASIRLNLEDIQEKAPGERENPAHTGRNQQNTLQESVGYFNRQLLATQKTLDELELKTDWIYTGQRRWLMILSVATGVLIVLVAVMFFLHARTPKTASASAEKKAVHQQVLAASSAPDAQSQIKNTASKTPDAGTPPEASATQPTRSKSLLSPEKAEKTIKLRSEYALTYLKRSNFERLGEKYVHPEKGVHFYPTGLKAAGRSFSANSFANVLFNPVKYDWGKASAEEQPIKHSFINYYKSYIYDQDFLAAPDVRFNEITFSGKSGLTADAIAQKYPGCLFAEYRKNGASLVLVFEHFAGPGVWYLVGVVHNG